MCAALGPDPKLNKHIILSKMIFFNWFDICFSQRGNISFLDVLRVGARAQRNTQALRRKTLDGKAAKTLIHLSRGERERLAQCFWIFYHALSQHFERVSGVFRNASVECCAGELWCCTLSRCWVFSRERKARDVNSGRAFCCSLLLHSPMECLGISCSTEFRLM